MFRVEKISNCMFFVILQFFTVPHLGKRYLVNTITNSHYNLHKIRHSPRAGCKSVPFQ